MRAIGGIGNRIRKIKAIMVAIEGQGSVTRGIVHNLTWASAGTAELTSEIDGVVRASKKRGAAATQVLASVAELPRPPEHLSAKVSRILATVRTA